MVEEFLSLRVRDARESVGLPYHQQSFLGRSGSKQNIRGRDREGGKGPLISRGLKRGMRNGEWTIHHLRYRRGPGRVASSKVRERHMFGNAPIKASRAPTRAAQQFLGPPRIPPKKFPKGPSEV
ncbi:hypothetical protein HPP92_007200 [Vanilla planifolia]|uniref:Uncharacterized protein n=1 Tax=Vanilla planifolia TaxID=51239 RepID=A0A835RC77_VANPL|nr:hypothetical protein HPP92_007200 [Vanilla planifolia]